MKKLVLLLVISVFTLQFTGCSMSETMSSPKNYNLYIENNTDNAVKLYVHKGAGEYEELIPVNNVFNVNIPAMGGGYSKFLGVKFNKHIPEDYEVIKLMKGEQLLSELSINQIEALEKDKAGNFIIKVN